MSVFFERLSQLCAEHGETPNSVAKKLHIPSGSITAWKKGSMPRMATVTNLASFFHVTTDYLLGNVNDPFFHLDTERILQDINSYYEDVPCFPSAMEKLDFSRYHPIPILGRISAGLPIYAEQNIEGYTLTDLNGGAEYFALRVSGDSMNAIGINDGYLIIARRQDAVENGEVAVVMVGDEDATVKRFYSSSNTVTLVPQSTNPNHTPQIYDLGKTTIKVLGKVVKVEFTL